MLTTSQSYVTYQGNGVTTEFPYNFYVQQAGHMVVSITDNTQDPAQTTVLSASQYSVTGIGSDTGGTVTYPLSGSELPAGWSITIQRIVPYQQSTSLTNQGAFYPQVVEAALDFLTMGLQQIEAQLTGAVPAAGPKGVDWRGPYDPSAYYNQGDGVGWNSQIYVALAESNNKQPDSNPDVWAQIAQGPAGPAGPTGPQGIQGPAGPTGAQGPAGGINWRGDWDAGTAYNQGDGVALGGVLYVAVEPNTGDQPPNTSFWEVTQGAAGPQGPAGPTGATGPEGPQGPQGPAGPASFQDAVASGTIGNGTVYQNEGASPLFVCAWMNSGGVSTTMTAMIGSTSVPNLTAGYAQQGAGSLNISFVVPPGWYWSVTASRNNTITATQIR